MIKIIANFLLLWMSLSMAINLWLIASKSERIGFIKTAVYGLFTAIITFVILATIVILF